MNYSDINNSVEISNLEQKINELKLVGKLSEDLVS